VFILPFLTLQGLLSMTGRTVAAVIGGTASNGEEREAGERGYYSSLLLCYLFFSSPVFCSPIALASAAPSVSDDGGAVIVGGAAGDKAE
jgi:hypothetical protein